MTVITEVSYTGQNSLGSLGGNVRLDEAKGQLVAFNGANNLGLFGFDSKGNVVLKVAKPGFDADTATDQQLAFNSQQNTLKVVSSNTINLSKAANNTVGTATLNHNLGYAPAVLAYVFDPSVNTYQPLNYQVLNMSTGAVALLISFDVTEKAVNFYALSPTNAGSLYTQPFNTTIKYYLLQESAN